MTSLNPRNYQTKLFHLAKDQNIIAVLGTGGGKTFISVMLMRYMCMEEARVRSETGCRKKMVFFLVNLVPLVFQQAQVIRDQTSLRVGHYCGEMNVDLWGEEQWHYIFDNLDVLVMTGQIFFNLLVHGFLSMDQVLLLIFDECHHARKFHPYCNIMRDFYMHTPVKNRPRVFGMTASPVARKADVYESVKQLEENLDSRAFTVSKENTEELRQILPTVSEKIVEYELSSQKSDLFEFVEAREFTYTSKQWNRFFRTVSDLRAELGVFSADDYIVNSVSSVQNADSTDVSDVEPGFFTPENIENLAKLKKTPLQAEFMSEKVKKLITVLLSMRSQQTENFCCIVFVEKRVVAQELLKIFQNFNLTKRNFSANMLIGHGTSHQETQGMRFKDQERILNSFRNRELNLLFATSVAEEGLDLPCCSTVVRFDLCRTLVSHIQSRGRARHLNAFFILFVERGNFEQAMILRRIRDAENDMNKWRDPENTSVEKKGDNYEENDDENDDDDDDDDDEPIANDIYFTTEKAKVSPHSAVPIVYQYCAQLITDEFDVQKPEFQISKEEEGVSFICNLILPPSSPLRVVTEIAGSKKRAKRLAAFNACKQLFEKGALDIHLLPHEKEKTENDNGKCSHDFLGLLDGMQVDRADVPVKGCVKEDQIWNSCSPWISSRQFDSPGSFYAYRFDFSRPMFDEPFIPLAIICPHELPQLPGFTLYAADGLPVTIEMKCETICLSIEQIDKLKVFTSLLMRYIFLAHRKENLDDNAPDYIWQKSSYEEWNDAFLCLTGPIESANIDWNIVDRVLMCEKEFQQNQDVDISSIYSHVEVHLKNHSVPLTPVATDILDFQKRFIITGFHSDLNPTSIISDATSSSKDAKEETYEGRYVRAHRRIPYTSRRLPPINPDQPLCAVSRAPVLRNFLIPPAFDREAEENKMSSAREKSRLPTLRIPQFLIYLPIPAEIYRFASLLPAIFSRIESMNAANQMKMDLELQELPLFLAMESITAPATNMGYNYERLETLGDAFLKIAIGLHLFVKHPEKHEGQLSYTRHVLASNQALYRRGATVNLPQYIRHQPVAPKSWRFPRNSDDLSVISLVGSSGKKRNLNDENILKDGSKKFISDDTIADSVEALLGAALLTGGIPLALKTAQKLDIPIHDINNWDDYIGDMQKQLSDISLEMSKVFLVSSSDVSSERIGFPVNEIESLIDHHFEHELLLIQAFNHQSSPYRHIPAYQRLEYLGDAVLDFLVIRFLYNINISSESFDCFPAYVPRLSLLSPAIRTKIDENSLPLDPGRMTDLKMLAVNNTTLAFIACATGLSGYILHFSDPLFHAVGKFSRWVDSISDAVQRLECLDEKVGSLAQLPWWWFAEHTKDSAANPLDSSDESSQCTQFTDLAPRRSLPEPPAAPKVVSDVLEALIGAVFIDTKFDLDRTFNLIDRLLQISSTFLEKNQALKRPVEGEQITQHNFSSKCVPFERWIKEFSYEALYFRMNPVRKLLEWFESRTCQELVYWRVPYKNFSAVNERLFVREEVVDRREHGTVVEIPSSLWKFETANAEIRPDNTQFTHPVIAVYVHGYLLGVGIASSYKAAKLAAAKHALVNLNQWIKHDLSIVLDDQGQVSARMISEVDAMMHYGKRCTVCSQQQKTATAAAKATTTIV